MNVFQTSWLFSQKAQLLDVRMGYKYICVLSAHLKPIYKDILLWTSVRKIAAVLYYHHRFIIQRDKIEQQSNTS